MPVQMRVVVAFSLHWEIERKHILDMLISDVLFLFFPAFFIHHIYIIIIISSGEVWSRAALYAPI
jgi:hypothetical protein